MKKLIIIFFLHAPIVLVLKCNVSIVYNLRIAETTKVQDFDGHFTCPSLATLTLFEQLRKKVIGTHESYGGGLGSYVYFRGSFYVRADVAFAHVQQHGNGSHFSKVQSDDVLFSSGYSFKIHDRARLTISGLLGVPTHNDRSLVNPQFGFAHVGLGTQIDSSLAYSRNRNYTLRAALRYIRFLKRKITFEVNDSVQNFDYRTGNLVDIFLTHHGNFGNHRLEYGYDLTFLFGSQSDPFLEIAAQKADYIRNNFYGSYKYRFLIKNYKNAITAAISCGFDQRKRQYRNKYILTLWTSWGVNF